LLIVIPKYFVSVTISSCWSCITYGCFFVVLALVMCMTLHLSPLNAIFHCFVAK
jgi:hypothetical protein